MKSTLISLLFLFCALYIPAFSQTIFAPPGAHWYNDGEDAYYHSYSDGDTIIDGHTCTIIRRDTHKTPLSWAHSFQPLFTYVSFDTVFVFNSLFNKFTPLFIFNVSEGDTVRIPRLYNNYYPMSATNFAYRVDSVRTILYDTARLKTIYAHCFNEDSTNAASDPVTSYFTGGPFGAYAERIGSIYGGSIYPGCYGCPVPTSDGSYIGKLRCYSDTEMHLKFTPNNCIPNLSVEKENSKLDKTVYPNPAKESLRINAPAKSTITLFNLQGETVQTGRDTNILNVASLPPGVYLLRVVSENGVTVKRVIVER